jgi:hypothetical protein
LTAFAFRRQRKVRVLQKEGNLINSSGLVNIRASAKFACCKKKEIPGGRRQGFEN